MSGYLSAYTCGTMNPLRATHHRAHGAAAVFLLVAALLVVRPQVQPAHAATPPDPVAYAIAGQAVNVIDTGTNTKAIPSPIALPSCPVDLAITPDARYVLVVLSGFQCNASPAPPQPELVMIDATNNTLVSAATVKLPDNPRAIAISPNGATAYITFPAPPSANLSSGGIVAVPIGPGATLGTGSSRPLLGLSPGPVAVSPDGSTVYALTGFGCGNFGCLIPLPAAGGAAGPAIPVSTGGDSVVISPNGSTAFIGNQDDGAGFIEPVDLVAKVAKPIVQLGATPVSLAIGTTPNGISTLYVADDRNSDVIALPLNNLTQSPPPTIGLPTIPNFLAVTPDGGRLEVTTARGTAVSVPTTGVAQATCSSPCPAGSGPVAITPDFISPAFNATAATAGQPSGFDASGSSFAFWTQVTYSWNFGDGSAPGTGATPTHVYANPGTYTVVLTETDGSCAANSAPQVFTGQTMTRRCGAPVRKTITIPAAPTPGASPTPTPTPTTPAGTPVLALNPVVGPPGIVVAVAGSGFAPNATVVLVWQPGIGSTTVKADGSGSFHTFALVFSHDRIGKRQMAAQGTAATAQFLVVPPSVSPGGHDAEVVFRR